LSAGSTYRGSIKAGLTGRFAGPSSRRIAKAWLKISKQSTLTLRLHGLLRFMDCFASRARADEAIE
jgi:hypothetical protein